MVPERFLVADESNGRVGVKARTRPQSGACFYFEKAWPDSTSSVRGRLLHVIKAVAIAPTIRNETAPAVIIAKH